MSGPCRKIRARGGVKFYNTRQWSVFSSFTKNKFSVYKSTEACKHFESGFVLNMGLKKNKKYAIINERVSQILLYKAEL